ncbi:hypothetical protein AB0945_28115 [Streptomyces sp. NPDC005474]|uniref:hypothetical protein n=1 Tax=Streptomyces sp. NPDC005474 TaxID=3154878 RepID=UPI003456AF03
MSETVDVPRSEITQRCRIDCVRVGEPELRRAEFRLTVTNDSDAVVPRWAMSFALPAGAHAYGDGTEFDIAPEISAVSGRPALFEVECLGDVYMCAATWDLAPGAQAAVRVTVHSPNGLPMSSGPQGLSVLS